MDVHRFDAFARTLASGTTRRAFECACVCDLACRPSFRRCWPSSIELGIGVDDPTIDGT